MKPSNCEEDLVDPQTVAATVLVYEVCCRYGGETLQRRRSSSGPTDWRRVGLWQWSSQTGLSYQQLLPPDPVLLSLLHKRLAYYFYQGAFKFWISF